MPYSLSLHLLGIILWFSSLMYITRLIKVAAAGNQYEPGLVTFIGRSWKGILLPGLVLTLLSGLYQISKLGFGVYMQQGWFHTKLTLLIILFVVTFFVGKEVKNVQARSVTNPSRSMMLHGISALLLILIILVTMLGKN